MRNSILGNRDFYERIYDIIKVQAGMLVKAP